jgi:hypothetical protein
MINPVKKHTELILILIFFKKNLESIFSTRNPVRFKNYKISPKFLVKKQEHNSRAKASIWWHFIY